MRRPRFALVLVSALALAAGAIVSRADSAYALSPGVTTIDTYAGGGTGGAGGDPKDAALGFPYDVAVNAQGHVFVSDIAGQIYKIADGAITKIAGLNPPVNCPCTYAPDGSLATSAMLWRPTGIAADADDNVYVAQEFACTVSKIGAAGIVTTVAGQFPCSSDIANDGSATSANVWFPTGLALTPNGDLYIAEYDACRVRKVSNGLISTVAGHVHFDANGWCSSSGDGGIATDANLGIARDVAVAADGSLYIAEPCNVRKVEGGVITTVAGPSPDPTTGQTRCGYNGDGPASTTTLNDIYGISTDASGNLIIADTANCLIRKLSNGTITTIAGNIDRRGGPVSNPWPYNACGFDGDGGPATSAQLGASWAGPAGATPDDSGNLFIADSSNARIRVVSRDVDADGVPASDDNCPVAANSGQADADEDGLGDACETSVTATDPLNPDTDGDGCADGEEYIGTNVSHLFGGDRDPASPWDFFDVPVPALGMAPASSRDRTILLSDVLAIVAYIGTTRGAGANGSGLRYDSDIDQDGQPDGSEYDRTPYATFGGALRWWRAGPPDGSVTLQDALVALGAIGDSCRLPP